MAAAGIDLLLSSICYNATFCDYFYDNTISDTLLTKKQNETFALQNEVNGKHLRIGTLNNYPLNWVEEINGTLVGQGVSFVLLDILQKRFNFTYELVVPENNFLFGSTAEANSLIGLINSSRVDMGAALVPILYDFQSKVSFSPGLDEGIWSMMLKRPTESAAGSGLLAPFENHVWYLILAAVLSYGPCITVLTRLRSKFLRNDEEHIKLSPSFWFVYGAFIKQGTTLSPEANTTRVLFATWWIFIILLSAFYTANLTAFLTLSKFTLDVEYPFDLLKKNYRWVATKGGSVQFVVNDVNEELHYLATMVTKGRGSFRDLRTDEEFLGLVKAGAVLIKEQTAIDHAMYRDYLNKARQGIDESDRCTFVVAPHPFMLRMRGFAYPKNSTLMKLFDPVLHYLVQAGMLKYLTHRDLPSTKICPLDLQSKDRRLRNSDLMMTYMIMVAGLAAAQAVFIGEVIIKRYLHIRIRKNKKHTRKKVSMSRSSRNMNLPSTFYDDSKPPPYEHIFGQSSNYKSPEHKIINGREYYVVYTANGEHRLIPMRTPSAFLYQRNNK